MLKRSLQKYSYYSKDLVGSHIFILQYKVMMHTGISITNRFQQAFAHYKFHILILCLCSMPIMQHCVYKLVVFIWFNLMLDS